MKLIPKWNSALASLALVAPLTCLPHASAGDWAQSGVMNTPRANCATTLLSDGKVLVTGGTNYSGALDSAEVRDPATGAWTPVGPMKSELSNHTATLLQNGKVLVVGYYDAELYDPAIGTWTLTGGPVENYFYDHTATLLQNGKVLVVDSDDNGAEIYNPATGTWTPTPKLTYSDEHTATLLPDGKVLVVGGSNGVTEIYDSVTDKWSPGGVMNISRRGHTATLLANGKVLVAGGYGGIEGVELANAEIYDPAAGKWTLVGEMSGPRREHTANLLANGKVLVTGGYNYDYASDRNKYLSSTELFDPATGAWTPNGDMSTQRVRHSSVLLANGKLLIVGGHDQFLYYASTDLYTIPTPTAITKQPGSPTVKEGKRAILSVRAKGTGLTYQWYVGTSGKKSKPIKNATSRTFRTPPLEATTSYWVKVTGSLGSVSSKTAVVKVQ